MNKTYNFGKIDYYGNGRRSCPVELEIELKPTDKGEEFTASGNIWNNLYTDIIMGGQCIDDIWDEYGTQLQNRKLYQEIMELWKKYHLNGMNAGCIHQRMEKWDEVLLDDSKPKTQDNMAVWTYPKDDMLTAIKRGILDRLHGKTYKIARKILKVNVWSTNQHKKGLLTKACKVCGYKYGTAWLFEEIPAEDLARIKQLIGE